MKTCVAQSTSRSSRSSGILRAMRGPVYLTDRVSQAHLATGGPGAGCLISLPSDLVTHAELQALRATGFVGAALLAFLMQRLAPHARVRGSWRLNGGLWIVDTA